jgi:RNA polymerase sigma-70 factor (ECF subfamily)
MAPPDTTDETLVARMAGGDQGALSSLYDRYRAVVFSFARRVLGDRAEAEEVLTDVFLQAWRGAAGFDRSRGSVAGWLITLCRSRAIDRLRARGRREATLEALAREGAAGAAAGAPGDPEAARGPGEAAEITARRRRIAAALEGLSQPQRRAIELAYYGGLSQSEIAARLGEPLGTVKTRIQQGLMALRETLGGQLDR